MKGTLQSRDPVLHPSKRERAGKGQALYSPETFRLHPHAIRPKKNKKENEHTAMITMLYKRQALYSPETASGFASKCIRRKEIQRSKQ